MFAAQGALAALYRRTVTGEGQVVDAALTEACLAVQESTIPDYDAGGWSAGRRGPGWKALRRRTSTAVQTAAGW